MTRHDLKGTEAWREYDFGGRVYRIDNPVALYVREGGTTHRVEGADGVRGIERGLGCQPRHHRPKLSEFLLASPAARRREEAVRAEFRREAFDRIEGKLDTLVSMVKGGAKALPQPTILTEADVDDLALDLADGAVILPRGAVVSKVTQLFGDECRHLATQVTVGLLQWTPRQLLEQGLVKGNRWDWSLYQRLVSAVPERVDRWTRPHEAAEVPADEPRF